MPIIKLHTSRPSSFQMTSLRYMQTFAHTMSSVCWVVAQYGLVVMKNIPVNTPLMLHERIL